MTGNGLPSNYGDDWGMVYTHINPVFETNPTAHTVESANRQGSAPERSNRIHQRKRPSHTQEDPFQVPTARKGSISLQL